MPTRDPFLLPPAPLSRRSFLGTVAGSIGAAAFLAACAPGASGAGEGDSASGAASDTARTGTAGAGTPGPLALGLQLYTVREALTRDFDGTLAALAAAGYQHVETAGYAGRSVQDFKAALDRHGLHAAAMHVPIQQFRTDVATAIADARTLEAGWLVCPWLDPADRTEAGYRAAGETLARAAATAKDANVRVAYHNHEFEFLPVATGRTGLDILMEAGGPDVHAELDLFWAVKAGEDPLAVAAKYPGRVRLVHVKDAGPAPDRTMMDVGAGTIDFATILTRLKQQGLAYAFVEHDQPKDAIATARAGLAHLRTLAI